MMHVMKVRCPFGYSKAVGARKMTNPATRRRAVFESHCEADCFVECFDETFIVQMFFALAA